MQGRLYQILWILVGLYSPSWLLFKLVRERKITIEEVLEHIDRAPSVVLNKVFESLARSERTHQYPDKEMLEITRSAMFHPVLEIIVDELMREFNLTNSKDIEIQGGRESAYHVMTTKIYVDESAIPWAEET